MASCDHPVRANQSSESPGACGIGVDSHTPADPAWNSVPYLEAASYHVLQYRGDHILYDLRTATISLIDEISYDLLSLAYKMTKTAVEAKLSYKYDTRQLESAFDGIDRFRRVGFFSARALLTPDAPANEFTKLLNHRPRRIQLLVAQKCNLACAYCYAEQQGSNAIDRLMSYDTAKAAVDHLIEASGTRRHLTVSFFGGEPLLNFRLIKRVVKYCKEQAIKHNKVFGFTVATNGTLLDEDKISFLVKHGFTCVISIDGDMQTHNEQRPAASGENVYFQIIENAKRLQFRYGDAGNLTIRATTTAMSASRVHMADSLSCHGFTEIEVHSIDEKPFCDNALAVTAKHEALEVSDDDTMLDRYLESLQKQTRLPYNPCESWIRQLKTQREIIGIRCGVCRNMTAVDVEGNLLPCHRYEGIDAWTMGTVAEGMNRTRAKEFYRLAHENSMLACSSCWARCVCGGACTWLLTDGNGGLHAPTEHYCARVHARLERTLWLFVRMQQDYPTELERILDAQASFCGETPSKSEQTRRKLR